MAETQKENLDLNCSSSKIKFLSNFLTDLCQSIKLKKNWLKYLTENDLCVQITDEILTENFILQGKENFIYSFHNLYLMDAITETS